MAKHTATIRLPLCWDWLLANTIATPSQEGPAKEVHDRAAYREDDRCVAVTVGEYHVAAVLSSGETNYWLDWSVLDGADEEQLPNEDRIEPDMEIPPTRTLRLANGDEIVLEIERYESPKKARKGRRRRS